MKIRSVVTPMHCPVAHHLPSGAPVALETYNRVMPAPNIYQTLKQLMAQAVAAAPSSLERRRCLEKIYTLVMRSKKLWKEYSFDAEYYNDAVNDMWQECFANPEAYDPEVNEVTTWLNDALKRALRRHRDRRCRDQKRHISTWALLTQGMNRILSALRLHAGFRDIVPLLSSAIRFI